MIDHVFDQQSSNEDVYKGVVKPTIKAALEGMNVTIFAYGQTSSGKTYTMMGNETTPGIIQHFVNDIFQFKIDHPERDFLVR